MPRVFLSHSSSDKNFVEPIADLLGKNNCVYDKYTFEFGMKTIEEIFDCMDRTDIFVYFISEDSLKSKWVNDELNRAEELLTSPEQKIKQIYPLIIDSTINHSDKRIAAFLRKHYNLQRVESHVLVFFIMQEQIVILYKITPSPLPAYTKDEGASLPKPNKGRMNLWIINATAGSARPAESAAKHPSLARPSLGGSTPFTPRLARRCPTLRPPRLRWSTRPCKASQSSTSLPKPSRAARCLPSSTSPSRANAKGGRHGYER